MRAESRSAAISHGKARRGFTIVELLVTITIIGILISLLLPAVQAAREAARSLTCQVHNDQLSKAAANYDAQFGGLPGYINYVGSNPNPVSWFIAILPFLENQNIYDLWANGISRGGATIFPSGGLSEADFAAAGPGSALAAMQPAYQSVDVATCPSDPGKSPSPNDTSLSYVANRGVNQFDTTGCAGVFLNQCQNKLKQLGLHMISRQDGTSTTMMFSESPLTTGTPRRSVPTGTYYLYLILPSISPPYYDRPSSRWTGAVRISGDVAVGVENLPVSTDTTEAELNIAFEWGYLSSETSPITQKILSHHPNTVNVGFCDGHQRAMSYTTDVNVFRQLMTPSSEVCLSHYNAQNFWPPNMNPPPPTWLSGQDDRQYGKWGTSGSKYFPPIDGSMY